jgi:hypothetical protein
MVPGFAQLELCRTLILIKFLKLKLVQLAIPTVPLDFHLQIYGRENL